MQKSLVKMDSGGEPRLLSERSHRTLRLTLNRPARSNPLSEAMLDELSALLQNTRNDPEINSIVIASTGPAFCGGHDLKEMTSRRADPDGGRAYFAELFSRCTRIMQQIASHPKIFIAEVDGIATAAGCQLVAACDIAIASERSRFGLNGIDVGLFCSTPMVDVSRNIGRKKAMEMLTTGRLLDADEALSSGLISQVVPANMLRQTVDEITIRLAERPGTVLSLGKAAFYEQIEMPRSEAYRRMACVIADNMMLLETKEGISAFLAKRKPDWSR